LKTNRILFQETHFGMLARLAYQWLYFFSGALSYTQYWYRKLRRLYFFGTISGMLGLANLGLGEATLRYVAHYAAQEDLTGINRVLRATFL